MKTMQSPEHVIRISDTHLAAYLLVRGYQVLGVEGPSNRREFVFGCVPQEIVGSFYGGEDLVSARALLDALRNLRGLLAQAPEKPTGASS